MIPNPRTMTIRGAAVATVLGLTALLAACNRVTDILDVAPPSNEVASSQLNSKAGAEAKFAGAKASLLGMLVGADGVYHLSGMLSDEMTSGDVPGNDGGEVSVDARHTVGNGANYGVGLEFGDFVFGSLISNRSSILLALPGLQTWEPASNQQLVGEAWAYVGYTELMLAQMFCGGAVLDRALPQGGVELPPPVTTDSLLRLAKAHFDSALAHANGDANVTGLASIGLGRTQLERAQFDSAAAAVAAVPTSYTDIITTGTDFSHGTQNFWWSAASFCSGILVADHEGGNGLNFASSGDPRLVLDTMVASPYFGTVTTCDQFNQSFGPSYQYQPFGSPTRFDVPSDAIPFVTGIEARLIEAEVALHDNHADVWAAKLNDLRANSLVAGQPSPVPPLPADSTTGASSTLQVNVMFRERAFWLYGTGTRLPDLHRLVRQYGRDVSTVFPTGTYGGGHSSTFPTYQTDVVFTLPTSGGTAPMVNPHYQGCLTPTTQN